MNVLVVLGLAVLGYFVFVGLWLMKIEDYLDIEGTDVIEGGNGDAG